MRALIGIALLSAAVLLLQVALTRVFSIGQFYHFAFLVVSLALLGFGVSGSLLASWPKLRDQTAWYGTGFGVTTIAAYLFVNHLPFDSYSIAWDRTQIYLLIGNLLALAVPFVFAGALIGSLLSSEAERAGRVYGANLLGSAAGAVIAPALIAWTGSERVVLLCAALGMTVSMMLADRQRRALILSLAALVIGFGLMVMFPSLFEIQPSPYKRLSQFRLNPDAAITVTRQNAYSRLDIVDSSTIHSAQGLSLTYLGALPPQAGLLIDGDLLLPVLNASEAPETLAHALPAAVAYEIRPSATVLILGSGGGMDAWTALANGAEQATVIEPNDLVYEALTRDLRGWAGLADDPRVTLHYEEIRTFAQQSGGDYDIVQLALADNYRPISSGAFTLTENYTLTVEAFKAYLALCGDNGLLVVNRWLQSPPSEDVRTLGLIVEALEGRDPLQHVVAFRSFQTATFIVKPTPFAPQETDTLLEAIDRLRYDLTLAPEMPSQMINRYARLETPVYHDTYLELATTPDRSAFYNTYDFEVTPPTDDRPFFFHFFRWEQTPSVIENLGRRWQPFGGSGYFVLLALLAFALAAAVVFILLPIALRKSFREALRKAGAGRSMRTLGFFTAIGLAFLLVEIALIQRYMLVLGRPTLALALVIGALLLFSGLGSLMSQRLYHQYTIAGLALLIGLYPFLANLFIASLLALPLVMRVLLVALMIAPVGFLMGIPFAGAVRALSDNRDLVPWAWAVNGSASVVSAILASMLALSSGFTIVLLVGGGLYLVAALLAGANRFPLKTNYPDV
jgi:spermidine synthase